MKKEQEFLYFILFYAFLFLWINSSVFYAGAKVCQYACGRSRKSVLVVFLQVEDEGDIKKINNSPDRYKKKEKKEMRDR